MATRGGVAEGFADHLQSILPPPPGSIRARNPGGYIGSTTTPRSPADQIAARTVELARATVDGVLRYAPDGLRKRVYRSRRAWSRRRRAERERHEDFSRSHTALFGLEEFLETNLGTAPGFFVEAGAADGVFQSNTYWLERRWGWTGLLVEPVPELAREAALSRPGSRVVQCALVSEARELETITVRYASAMTHVHGLANYAPRVPDGSTRDIVVPARTLSSLLRDAGVGRVDFLSLDVEGYEAEALRGLNLDEVAPRFILVEVGDDQGRKAAVEQVIGGRYVLVAKPSPLDLFYRLHGEHG